MIRFLNNVTHNRRVYDLFEEDPITKLVDECNKILGKENVKLIKLEIKEGPYPRDDEKHHMLKDNYLITMNTYIQMVNYLLEKKYNLIEIHNQLG